MARLDRERYAAIPLQSRAGVVGDRPLAADLIEAPAFARALVVEALGEQSFVVEGPAIAAIMNAVAEKCFRPVQVIEIR